MAEPDDTLLQRAVFASSLALLAFGVATGILVLGWISHATDPFSWPGFVSVVTALGAIGVSAVLWHRPSKEALAGGICVLLFSLLRVGSVGSWGSATLVVVVLTAIVMAPLVIALVLLSRA